MTYRIEQLSPELGFGKIVRGLRSTDISQESVRIALRRAWVDDGLLVFRDGEISDDFQVGLSCVFGPLERHPVREIQVAANPDLIRLTSVPGTRPGSRSTEKSEAPGLGGIRISSIPIRSTTVDYCVPCRRRAAAARQDSSIRSRRTRGCRRL
jgi:hypothetical protein